MLRLRDAGFFFRFGALRFFLFAIGFRLAATEPSPTLPPEHDPILRWTPFSIRGRAAVMRRWMTPVPSDDR
jgi:hypothetical protein